MDKDKTAKVPVNQKIAWGLGGFSENLANNAILTLAYPIYNVALGLNPMFIGIALAASRILDAVTDPVMGSITDNTESRWGRRRPWIFLGAIIMALFFFLVWIIPVGMGQTGNFIYFTVMCVLFFIGFTIFIIPYSGLGLEMVVDYDERTVLQTFRLVPAFIGGMMTPWLYKLSLLDIFQTEGMPTELNGIRYVGAGAALLILVTSLAPALFTRERYARAHGEKMKIFPALKMTFSDRPFLMLVGAYFFVFIGLFFINPLMVYIGIYHVCLGDKVFYSEISGWAGSVSVAGQLVAMPFIAWVAKYVDKKTVLFTGLSVAIIGYISSWWLFTPVYPWLLILPLVVSSVGLTVCWVVNGSFVADICDFDELKTGSRREGMYSAVFGFIYKNAIGIVALLSSSMLVWAGIDEQTQSVAADSLTRVRLAYLGIPAVCLVISIVLMVKYPLTRSRVEEIQNELKKRRGEVGLQS
jgi:Na+/melibiose symporter-like transporter